MATAEELSYVIETLFDKELYERRVKKVVRKGRVVRKTICPKGKKAQDGKCVTISGGEKQRRKVAARKAARTRRTKPKAAPKLSTKRSLKKRKSSGLR